MHRELMTTRRRIYLIGLWLFVLGIVGTPAVFKLSGIEIENNLVAATIAARLLIAFLVFHVICSRPIRCPRCRRFLRVSPNRGLEHKEMYVCRRCEVEWDTGVTISDT